MALRSFPFLAPVMFVLAACSGGDEAAPLQNEIAASVVQIGQGLTRREEERPPLTRAVLNTLDGEFLEVTRERLGQVAFLYVEDRARDDQPGRLTVWRTDDNVSLVLRNGVLIQTRGLGGGLSSGDALVQGDRLGPSRSGQRTYTVSAFDNSTVSYVMACDVAELGSETIVIVERRHPTQRVQETCKTNRGDTVVNDYWIDRRAGVIWQSRQWGGPNLGYFTLRQVTP